MADSTYYRDAARENIYRQLELLKAKKEIAFIDVSNGQITKQQLQNIPNFGITDEELRVVTDSVISVLNANPFDPRHTYLSVDISLRFYYRFINAILELLFRAVANVSQEKRQTITIMDFLNALYVLEAYGIPKSSINNLHDVIGSSLDNSQKTS